LEAAMSEPKAPIKKPVNWWDYCPVCGFRLIGHKCRFVCSNPKCHYFQSCSEFDT
jgi:hypothetical protein